MRALVLGGGGITGIAWELGVVDAWLQGGVDVRTADVATRDFRMDWLFSFVPSPGTVMFAGYGSSLTEPEAFRWIQKTSMDRRLSMREVADAVVAGMPEAKA